MLIIFLFLGTLVLGRGSATATTYNSEVGVRVIDYSRYCIYIYIKYLHVCITHVCGEESLIELYLALKMKQ